MDERPEPLDGADQLRQGLSSLVASGPDPASRMEGIDERIGAIRRTRVDRRRVLTVAAAATGIAGAGALWRLTSTDDDAGGRKVAAVPDEPASSTTDRDGVIDVVPGMWQSIPPAPLQPRRGAAAVWAGDRLVVWGGTLDGLSPPDAAQWSPSTGWTSVATSPVGSVDSTFALWDGREVLVGVAEASSSAPWNVDVSESDAGYGLQAFDPVAGTWRHAALLARDPQLARAGVQRNAVLLPDGRLLVAVRAAHPDGGHPDDLQLIDPATGAAEPVALGPYGVAPYPDLSGEVQLAVAGNSVVAVPNWDRRPWALDLDARTWRRLPEPPVRPSLHLSDPVSVGDQVVVGESDLAELWMLDPAAVGDDIWRPAAAAPEGTRWTGLTGSTYPGVWSGRELFVPGAAYDPSADTWRQVSGPPGATDVQRRLQSFWAGDSLVLFGGERSLCPGNAKCDQDPEPDSLDGWLLTDP